MVEPFIVPDFLRNAINLADEREALCKKQPKCPECKTYQVQIISVGLQEWKCRHCKLTFFTDYEI